MNAYKIVALGTFILTLASIAFPIKSQLGSRGASNGESSSELIYDAEVEWLESTGSEYINTGLFVVAGLGYDVVAALPSGLAGWRYYALLGWTNDYQGGGKLTRTYRLGLWVQGNVKTAQFAVSDGRVAFSNIEINQSFETMVLLSYDWYENMFYANGASIANTNVLTYETETRNVKSIPLFGERNNNNFVGAKCRIQSARFYYYGNAVLDLIAVRFTNEDGEAEGAMYDRRTCRLYRNQGSGQFVIGPDKEVE